MKIELALATAVIKTVLANGLVESGATSRLGSDASVTVLSPDAVDTAAQQRPLLNLFMYQAQPKGIRQQVPEDTGDAATGRLPSSWDLMYLLSAHGTGELQTEVLLGCVLDVLDRNAVLRQPAVEVILNALTAKHSGKVVNPALVGLDTAKASESLCPLQMCPQSMTLEDLSKLWSVLQVRFRPSVIYKVTVAGTI